MNQASDNNAHGKNIIIFLTHGDLILLDNQFAGALKDSNVFTVAFIHGEQHKLLCKSNFSIIENIGFDPKNKKSQSLVIDINHFINEVLPELEKHPAATTTYSDLCIDRHASNRLTPPQTYAYLFSLYLKFISYSETYNIKAVIGESNYIGYRLIRKVCLRLGIPYISYINAPMFYDRFFLDDTLSMEWKHRFSCYQYLTQLDSLPKHELLAPFQDKINDSILKLVNGVPATFTTDLLNSDSRQKIQNRIITALKEYFTIFISRNQVPSLPLNPTHTEILPHQIIKRKLLYFYRKIHYKSLSNKLITLPKKYVLYFLHHQPEFTIDTVGNPIRDQAFIVERISEALPSDYKLIVKEHYFMPGNRQVKFLKSITSHPNVIYLSANVRPDNLIASASLSLTVSGTLAIESIYNDIPVILLSHYYSSSFPGIVKCTDFYQLPVLIKKLLTDWKPLNHQEKNDLAASIYMSSSKGNICIEIPDKVLSNDNLRNLKTGFLDQLKQLQVI